MFDFSKILAPVIPVLADYGQLIVAEFKVLRLSIVATMYEVANPADAFPIKKAEEMIDACSKVVAFSKKEDEK